MDRKKVFISMLGSNKYKESIYTFENKSMKTDYLAYFLCQEVVKPDIIIIIGTEQSDWGNYPRKYFQKCQTGTGQSEWEEYPREHFPKYKEVIIPFGKNEDELWQAFKIIMQEIIPEVQGSDVYFDITHGFRSLSFFIFTVIRLINIIADAEIKGVFYGMYEADGEKKPVVDLKPIIDLDNLIYSFKAFLDYGDAYPLSTYLEEYLSGFEKDRLRDYSEVRALSKVLKTLSNAYFTNALRVYFQKLSDIEDFLKKPKIIYAFENDARMYAIGLLFNKFKCSDYYNLKNLEDYISFASIYRKSRRFGQALEVLREGFISYLMTSCGTEDNASNRKKWDYLFGTLSRKPEDIQDESLKAIRDIAAKISDLKNAVAHAFTLVEDEKANSIVKNIEEHIDKIIQDINELRKEGLQAETCKLLKELSEKTNEDS